MTDHFLSTNMKVTYYSKFNLNWWICKTLLFLRGFPYLVDYAYFYKKNAMVC